MNLLSKLNERISGLIKIFLTILMVSTSFLVLLQVLFRYCLRIPTHYIDELLIIGAVLMFMFGALNASIDESHIIARIFENFSKKKRYVTAIRFIAAVSSFLVMGWLTYWAYEFFTYSLKRGRLSVILKIPTVIYESTVFICFLGMTFYACLEAYKYFKMFKESKKGDEF